MSQLERDNIESLKTIIERLIISPTTRIFQKGDENYKENAYQYATSSHEGMSPSLIIYPESSRHCQLCEEEQTWAGGENWRSPIFRLNFQILMNIQVLNLKFQEPPQPQVTTYLLTSVTLSKILMMISSMKKTLISLKLASVFPCYR